MFMKMTPFPSWQAFRTNYLPGQHLPPPVPIKTYLWEEVRRDKEAGVYPWTHIFKGPYDEQEFEEQRDHEYEPINPPATSHPPPTSPPPTSPPSPPLLKVTDQEGEEKESEPERVDFRSIFEDRHHKYLRIPLDRDMVIPIDKAEIESLRYDDEEEEETNKMQGITMEDVQDHEEARNFAATPATTISRTDGEFNTSQMDSSGLDELPLKREARRGFNARGFQQRISSQAGRLRTRIRNISRPKINFPERPKFNLPDRPKMNFERPKFNFPERPKFNIKRPDLKMPNFNFGKTKTSSLRRPLRDKAQIPSNQSTVGSKKNIFDSINFRTYPRIFSKKKKAAQGRRALTPPPRMETQSTPPSTPGSRTGPFNQRWTQRFRDIKFADADNQSDLKKPSFEDDAEDDSAAFRDPDFKAAVTFDNESKQKAESSISIPGSDREQQSSGSSSERHRAGVIEEIDSDEFFLREKGLSREDVDVSRYLSLEIRDAFRSPKNALASLGREEYDDDNEGYDSKPRPTGEPVRMSMEAMRNQSSEQMRMTPERDIEYTGDEEIEEEEPVRPERTRSLKKRSTRSKSEEPKQEIDSQFNTFPPNRPTRVRKQSSQSKQSIPVDYDEDEKENVQDIRPPSIPSLHVTDTTKEMSPTRYIDESSEALDKPWVEEPQPPLPPKRRKSTRDSSQDKESLRQFQREQWMDEDAQADDMVLDNHVIALQRDTDQSRAIQNGHYDSPPPPPMRKSRSQGTSLAEDDRTSRGAESLISESRTHMTEDLETKPDILPVIIDSPGYAVIEKTVMEGKQKQLTEKPKRPPPPSRRRKTAAQLAALKNQSINFFFTYPRRAIKKKLHMSSPPPIRPVRNYSTIGPTRPPRGNRVFREPVYEGEFIPLKDENDTQEAKEKETLEYIENEIVNSVILDSLDNEKSTIKYEQEEVQEMRDLQSEDVIEKMKDRPLPPPPRPPRKTREEEMRDEEDVREFTEEEVETTDLDEQDVVVSERIDILVGHPHHDHETKREKSLNIEPVEEVCERQTVPHTGHAQPEILSEPPVKTERRKKSLSQTRKTPLPAPVEANVSTQTDTLPDGFYVEEEQQTSADYSRYEESSSETPRPAKEPEVEKKVETIIEHKVVVIPTPETEILKAKKIHVAELDVDKLNVTELQAHKITVSDIDGVSMQVAELTSKSGHLVVSGFELPSSFLEAITPQPPPAPVIHIQSSTQTPPEMTDSQTNTTPQQEVAPPSVIQPMNQQESLPSSSSVQPLTQVPPASPLPAPPSPPRRPSPPPTIVIHSPQGQHVPGYVPSSPPPRSPPRTRSQDSEEELRMVPRRRRHHSHKQPTQLSTDEEEEDEFHSYPIARRPHQREATAVELIRQLLGIWHSSASRGMNQAIEVLNAAFPEGEKRKDAQTAACIVLVLIAGLLLLGFGQDRTVHHHHWDFLPPHP
ncbi:titin-like isoform X2 [Macrosteles quadrilineatus]|uniref:titin-like isoform X2 n=1 Tax=Macrosteles quadrilineatus TaxID=74068 RepID=UPI0023E2D0A2|nr:titin-like isoform X2 [Macrosteles quadrilineatus]